MALEAQKRSCPAEGAEGLEAMSSCKSLFREILANKKMAQLVVMRGAFGLPSWCPLSLECSIYFSVFPKLGECVAAKYPYSPFEGNLGNFHRATLAVVLIVRQQNFLTSSTNAKYIPEIGEWNIVGLHRKLTTSYRPLNWLI